MAILSLFYLLFVEVRVLLLVDGALNTEEILSKIYLEHRDSNFGAIINFVGVVRAEDDITALSFDIYEPILRVWFDEWSLRLEKLDSKIIMAHSIGDVEIHHTSFIASVLSPKRRIALEMIDEFVEDFKKNAPIWKYDVIDNRRIYAIERSQKIDGAGLLF